MRYKLIPKNYRFSHQRTTKLLIFSFFFVFFFQTLPVNWLLPCYCLHMYNAIGCKIVPHLIALNFETDQNATSKITAAEMATPKAGCCSGDEIE